MNDQQKSALADAVEAFRLYRDGTNDQLFSNYIQAFNRACGLTGWADADVWAWIVSEINAKA